MTIQVIELTNSTFNGTSSLLSTIVLTVFIFFTVVISSRLYDKLNPKAKYKDPNIFNSAIQNTMGTIQYLMGGIVQDNMDSTVEIYKTEITNLSDAVKESTNYSNNVVKLVSALNNTIYNQFASKINSFNTFFENTKTTIGKLQGKMDEFNNKYQNLYENYKTRLTNYVDNLISFMGKVSEQITKVTVIPALFNMITPLKKIYNAILGTLKNNLPFIQKIKGNPNYSIPGTLYDSTAKTNLNTGFMASRSILTMAGYK